MSPSVGPTMPPYSPIVNHMPPYSAQAAHHLPSPPPAGTTSATGTVLNPAGRSAGRRRWPHGTRVTHARRQRHGHRLLRGKRSDRDRRSDQHRRARHQLRRTRTRQGELQGGPSLNARSRVPHIVLAIRCVRATTTDRFHEPDRRQSTMAGRAASKRRHRHRDATEVRDHLDARDRCVTAVARRGRTR